MKKSVLHRTNLEENTNEAEKNFNVTVFLTDKEKFVQDFNICVKKTAQSTLEMCKVVYDAKYTLTKDNFDSFCREIGQKSSDSTIRKYLAIGEKYDDFINYADKLPNSWTSIYKITQIDSNTFSVLVNTDNSFATMRAKDIDFLINANKPSNSNSSQNTSNQSSTASTVDSDAETSNQSANAVDIRNSMSDDVTDFCDNSTSPFLTKTDNSQDIDQSIDDSMTIDAQTEPSIPKTPISNDELEPLSDDFQVVIKFNTQPSKKTYKDFVDFMMRLSNHEDFDLDIKFFIDAPFDDSSEINQITRDAISKIAVNSELTSSQREQK